MKALSVRQPWASMLVAGLKTIELRTWAVDYRGPIAIVASKTGDRSALRDWPDGPRGAIVGVVELIDIRDAVPLDSEASCFELAPDDDFYAWVVVNAVATQPVACRGRLGLFDIDSKLVGDKLSI